MNLKHKIAGTALVGAMSLGALAGPAAAQTRQDGLVNVEVGDITILEDVNIAAAVDVVAQLCGIDLDVAANLALLGNAAQRVDDTSRSATVCRSEDGKVKFVQN